MKLISYRVYVDMVKNNPIHVLQTYFLAPLKNL